MSTERPFTHKGWYWFCPVYMADDHGTFIVEARWLILEPLFSLAVLFDQLRIFVSTMVVPNYEPEFMFKVTGPLKKPNGDDYSGWGVG